MSETRPDTHDAENTYAVGQRVRVLAPAHLIGALGTVVAIHDGPLPVEVRTDSGRVERMRGQDLRPHPATPREM